MADERIQRVTALLDEAASAHHDYEEELGERDEAWASWYANHALEHDLRGALGTTPTAEEVAEVLSDATDALEREPVSREWPGYAAEHVVARLG